MGASPDNLVIIADLYSKGLIPQNAAVADVGCQQLRDAAPSDVEHFLSHFNVPCSAAEVAHLATHNTFIYEHLKRAGFRYRSFDIVEAPNCEYLDINTDAVPRRHRSAFDLVLNFGTTEHVLNQYNAMKILHDLARPGGLIYSLFIRGGHMEHGLLHYSDQFIDLLCRANRYETVWRFDHHEPGNQCTWIVLRKTFGDSFQPPIDIQLGEEFPQLMKPPARKSFRWLTG